MFAVIYEDKTWVAGYEIIKPVFIEAFAKEEDADEFIEKCVTFGSDLKKREITPLTHKAFKDKYPHDAICIDFE